VEETGCFDLCLGRRDGSLQDIDLAGFLQDLARVACDYGLAVNTVEVHVHSPELRIAIASRDLRTFRRLWRSVEPNPNRGA